MMNRGITAPLLFALAFAAACPKAPAEAEGEALAKLKKEKAAAAVVDAGTEVVDAGPPPNLTPRLTTEALKCGPPARPAGLRVCGQSLVTAVNAKGELLGFTASADGMTLFSIKGTPASRADVVSMGAAGTGATLVQTTTDAEGKFDVQLREKPAIAVLCPGRVVATTESCAVIASKDTSIAATLVDNAGTLTWVTAPESVLVAVPHAAPPK